MFLSLTLLITLCAFSGCAGEKSSASSPSQNITPSTGIDVGLPVDSPSDMVSSNVMTKKNGVPTGSLIYEGEAWFGKDRLNSSLA